MRTKSAVLLVTGLCALSAFGSDTTRSLRPQLASIPLHFEPNLGQALSGADYVARGPRYLLLLNEAGADLTLLVGEREREQVRMRLRGANPTAPRAESPLPGRINYLKGDGQKWRTNIPTFARVRFASVYRGIDVVYHGNQGRLEYDFEVAPGADPRQIALRLEGARRLSMAGDGSLVMHLASGVLRWSKPMTYQVTDSGERRIVGSRYRLLRDGTVGFDVESYDRRRKLIIDPTLAYATLIGGSYTEAAASVAVDGGGYAYITGTTWHSYATKNPIMGNKTERDAFVTKFSPGGGALVYSTYLGGNWIDSGERIAVDRFGQAYVIGNTSSSDFPTTAGAFQRSGGSIFAAKLNSSGTGLVFSTRLGGSARDYANALALDSQHRMYIAGCTTSFDFPLANAYQSTLKADSSTGRYQNCNAFVTRLNSTGSALSYSTYLGGSVGDSAWGIAVNSAGEAYVSGTTSSPDFPTTPGAFQSTLRGGSDAFVVKFTADGSDLQYATLFGGSNAEYSAFVAIDWAGSIYLAGSTLSNDLPTVCCSYDRSHNGLIDGYVARLSPGASTLDYMTYLGGSDQDEVSSLTVNSNRQAFVTGATYSSNFPLKFAMQSTKRGVTDAFVTGIWATGGGLLFSTYYGGSSYDGAGEVRLDGSGNVYVAGWTESADFRTTSGAYDRTLSGPRDAFLLKLRP